jgi:hypothetical protein
MNLTRLFLTKTYLLNTIKPFWGHENRSLTKSQKTFTRGAPLGTWTSKFWVCRISSWPKRLREPKFQLSSSYGLGCRRGTNFYQRRRRRQRVTDGIIFIAFFHVLWLLSVKNMIWAKIFWCETNTFNIFHMKVKNRCSLHSAYTLYSNFFWRNLFKMYESTQLSYTSRIFGHFLNFGWISSKSDDGRKFVLIERISSEILRWN